jgi:hypothetical protein
LEERGKGRFNVCHNGKIMSTEAKCNCQHCNGHIAFPVEMAGQMSACPHCGVETKLSIPQTTDSSKTADAPVEPSGPQSQNEMPVKSSTIAWSYALCLLIPIAGFFFGVYLMAKKKAGHGAACMAISIVLGLFWIVFFSSHRFDSFNNRREVSNDIVSGEKNLKPVQGAYGWNLGDLLPSNFNSRTNDDGLGITCAFDPSGSEGICVGWLTLTEDRRIAAIFVAGIFTERRSAIEDMLKEKYGLRETHLEHLDVAESSKLYYGTINRQAVLNLNDLKGGGNQTFLEYCDEDLCRIASEETKNRKAAAEAAALAGHRATSKLFAANALNQHGVGAEPRPAIQSTNPVDVFLANHQDSNLEVERAEWFLSPGQKSNGSCSIRVTTKGFVLKAFEPQLAGLSQPSESFSFVSFTFGQEVALGKVFEKFDEWEDVARKNNAESFEKDIPYSVGQRTFSFDWQKDSYRGPLATLRFSRKDSDEYRYANELSKEDIVQLGKLLEQLAELKHQLIQKIQNQEGQNDLFK